MPQPNIANQTGSVLAAYDREIAEGAIEPDAAQRQAIKLLDQLSQELAEVRPSNRSLLSVFKRTPPPLPRGLYLHGGVGRGKTMLMDLFFANTDFELKRRDHFHQFMAEIHDRIGVARSSSDAETDPIAHVAKAIAPAPMLLCFDELHVTDIADAMILGRLFRALFASGTILVATSNAKPEELYKNGLNRQLFLPFIDLLNDHTNVRKLEASKDFRLDKLEGRSLYFTPANASARNELDQHWQRLTGTKSGKPSSLEVKGRTIPVPMASKGIARFSFDDLCSQPLGTRDYLLIARTFHTVVLDDIPIMTPALRNEARRFINLIDALYDNRVGLIASAQAEPNKLYPEGDGAEHFTRTASRLMEMRSPTFLQQRQDRCLATSDR